MESIPAPNVRWGEWISEGWEMFAVRWQVWVLQTLIALFLCAIPILSIYVMFLAALINEEMTGSSPSPPAITAALILVAMPLFFLLSVFLWGGLWRTATKQLRGEEISVRDLFSVGDVYLRLLGASIVLAILVFLGAIFFFFPALIVIGLLHYTIPLIVDRGLSIGNAMNASFNATKGHWFVYTLFAVVVSLIGQAGAFLCYVGLLASIPLQYTIFAIAYRDTFGIDGAHKFRQSTISTGTSYAGQSWPVSPQPATPPPAPRPLFSQTVESQQQPAVPCPRCGAAITRAAKFCNICGSPLQA
jgi:uncharacterized membrane protein